MDAKLGGALASLPSIAVQKVAIARLSDGHLISSTGSAFPALQQSGSNGLTSSSSSSNLSGNTPSHLNNNNRSQTKTSSTRHHRSSATSGAILGSALVSSQSAERKEERRERAESRKRDSSTHGLRNGTELRRKDHHAKDQQRQTKNATGNQQTCEECEKEHKLKKQGAFETQGELIQSSPNEPSGRGEEKGDQYATTARETRCCENSGLRSNGYHSGGGNNSSTGHQLATSGSSTSSSNQREHQTHTQTTGQSQSNGHHPYYQQTQQQQRLDSMGMRLPLSSNGTSKSTSN